MAKTRQALTNLTLNEVAICRDGMNPGAKIALFKAKDAVPPETDGEGRPIDKGDDEVKARSFDECLTDRAQQQERWRIADAVQPFLSALSESIGSILADKSVTDHAARIAASVDQFKGKLGQALDDAGHGEEEMMDMSKTDPNAAATPPAVTADDVTKAVQDAVTKALADAQKASDEKLAAVEKAANDRIAKVEGENAALREDQRKARLVKRFDTLGNPPKMTAEHYVAMVTKLGEDSDEHKALDEQLKSAAAVAASSDLFKSVGKSSGGDAAATAYDELMTKARAMVDAEKSKGLTIERAFAKVFKAPENAELVQRYQAERELGA